MASSLVSTVLPEAPATRQLYVQLPLELRDWRTERVKEELSRAGRFFTCHVGAGRAFKYALISYLNTDEAREARLNLLKDAHFSAVRFQRATSLICMFPPSNLDVRKAVDVVKDHLHDHKLVADDRGRVYAAMNSVTAAINAVRNHQGARWNEGWRVEMEFAKELPLNLSRMQSFLNHRDDNREDSSCVAIDSSKATTHVLKEPAEGVTATSMGAPGSRNESLPSASITPRPQRSPHRKRAFMFRRRSRSPHARRSPSRSPVRPHRRPRSRTRSPSPFRGRDASPERFMPQRSRTRSLSPAPAAAKVLDALPTAATVAVAAAATKLPDTPAVATQTDDGLLANLCSMACDQFHKSLIQTAYHAGTRRRISD